MNKEISKRLRKLGDAEMYDLSPSNKKKSKKKKKKKKGKALLSEKDLYDINLVNFQISLYKMLLTMNNMGEYPYLLKDAGSLILTKDVEINREFKKASSLNWSKPEDIDSLVFRGRFATLLTYEMIQHSHEIVKRIFKDVEEGEKKYHSYNVILEEFMTRVGYFITTFLTSDYEYADHLIQLYEVLLFVTQRDEEIINKIKETKKFLIENCYDPSFDSGILCNNIMKLAYVLSTENLNVKRTPEYVENINYHDPLITQQQIGKLGVAIMKRRKKEDVSLLYDCFQEADPKIISKFPFVDECPELIIGHRALELLKLFIGNKNVSNYINKIQRNV